MRILFMGSPAFALPTLETLMASPHEVVAVYCQPPRPAHRGQKETPCPVHQYASQHSLSVETPTSLKLDDSVRTMTHYHADITVVVAYGLILPKAILETPKYGCINLHPSLLPRWRGAAPLQYPILKGEPKTGVTIMQMDEGCDTGPMLLQETVELSPDITTPLLHDALAEMGASMMLDALAGIENGTLTATPQPDEGASYAAKLSKSDGKLDFTHTAWELDCRVRALQPWPGTYFMIGEEAIKVRAAKSIAGTLAPGETSQDADGNLLIGCTEGVLRIDEVQRQGRKPMPSHEMLRGFALPANLL